MKNALERSENRGQTLEAENTKVQRLENEVKKYKDAFNITKDNLKEKQDLISDLERNKILLAAQLNDSKSNQKFIIQ